MAEDNKTPVPGEHNSFYDEGSVEVYATFDDMPLGTNLMRGIISYGFEKPSAIQQRATVPLLTGKNVIAQPQTGTGRTGAFTVGLLQRMDFKQRVCQAVVLSPTRELAVQTQQMISTIGQFIAEGMPFCQSFVGGTPVVQDLRKLQTSLVVAVGTPSRVHDVIKRGALITSALKLLVLDETDKMLSQGFFEQILDIFKFLPKDVQVALFSATMPTEVLDLAAEVMREPIRFLEKRSPLTLEGTSQFYVAVEDEFKLETLVDVFDCMPVKAQSVIFCNPRGRVDWLADQLTRKEFKVSIMHADMHKAERENVMSTFHSGSSRILIATDSLAGGIAIASTVINYDLPVSKDRYLDRIGRSPKYGGRRVAINFVTCGDVQTLKDVEALYHTKIDELPMNFGELFV